MITTRYPRPNGKVTPRKRRFRIVRNTSHRHHRSQPPPRRRVAHHSSRNHHPKRKSLKRAIARATHLRLAKQPAGGATENRARGVRVELGCRPRRRRGGRSLFLGADDEGGAAGGGRPAGRRPRGHAHLGRGRREAKHGSNGCFAMCRSRDRVSAGEEKSRVRPCVREIARVRIIDMFKAM